MADISTVIDGLAAAPDPVLPDLLREHAPPLLSSNGGLLRTLVPRLRALDGHGDPWVQLVVAFACHDADLADAEAPELAVRALSGFRQSGDRRGEGFALYTLGNQAISRGDLATAVARWEGGRRLLGPESAAYAQALCNTSLGAYAEGDLRRALAIAEHGLAVSAQGGLHRAAGTARLYMAGCMLWTGEFARAAATLDRARQDFDGVVDPAERYEWPVCLALGGVLASLRGEPASAERQFDGALGAAEAVGADWIRAVVRVLRAEHAASWAAHRSVEDARLARELLDPLGEEWWSGVARIASGVALSSWDDHAAAAHVFEDALAVGHLIPLERVRCTLLLGETRLRLGRPRCAAPLLHQASSFFEQAGARFWAARACVALAQAETSSGVRHWQRAHSLAGHDVAFDRLLRGPASFRVQMLGRPRILVADDDVRFPSRHARLLVFAVAAAGSQGVSAEVLHTRLWPEADNSVGARRLKTALWQARRSLGPAAGRLRRRGMNVALSLAPGECDLIDTIAAAEALLTQPAPGRHALADAAIKLSRPVMGNEEYADWVTDLQDRLDALRFQLESTASQVMPGNGVAEHRPG